MSAPTTIDRIVANVLNRLGTAERVSNDDSSASGGRPHGASMMPASVTLNSAVITAEVVADNVNGAATIVIGSRTIVTPAAWDVVRDRGIEIIRDDDRLAAGRTGTPMGSAAKRRDREPSSAACVLIVRHTDAVDRAVADVIPGGDREVLGCPDDAASAGISAVCRGDAEVIVIFVEQTHRTACRANRNERVKAVAVEDAADIRRVRKQLRANVWCIDPTDRSYFELRNVLRAITSP